MYNAAKIIICRNLKKNYDHKYTFEDKIYTVS